MKIEALLGERVTDKLTRMDGHITSVCFYGSQVFVTMEMVNDQGDIRHSSMSIERVLDDEPLEDKPEAMGREAEDFVTGVRGKVVGESYNYGGLIQYQLAYLDDQGVLREEWLIDARVHFISKP